MAHRDLQNIDIVKIMLIRDSGSPYRAKQILESNTAVSVIKEFLAGEDRELFLTLNLDTSNRINSINIVSIGTVDANLIHPREVFKTAILSNASKIIIAHNHPSGNPNPSKEDIEITRKLFEVGEILGIKVQDHIIIGDDEYSSLAFIGKKICFENKRYEQI